MKAVIIPKIKKFLIEDVAVPKISDYEVLIKNKYAGFCGTDMHIYNGDFIANYPIIPGHEFSGIVEKVGKNVKRFKKGDRVVIDPTLSCNKCYYCRRNEQNFCINFGAYGVTVNGGFAEYSKILESNIYKIDNISLKEASLIEPLSCVIYGLNKINVNYGDKALVFGAGPIGLMFLQLLNIRGVSRVTLVDIDKEKIKIGEKYGASEVLLNDENLDNKLKSISEYGFDILIDGTGITKVCEQIFKYTNKHARVLLYGVCKKDNKISISPYQIYINDLSIYGAFSLNRTFGAAISLLNNKRINLESLISHEFKLNDFGEALSTVKSKKFSKIIFNCMST